MDNIYLNQVYWLNPESKIFFGSSLKKDSKSIFYLTEW